MTHNEYWLDIWTKARARMNDLFANSREKVDDVIGGDGFIDSYHDAKKLLAYVFAHCPTCEEKACAILSINEALHAWNEVNENNVAKVGAVAR